MKKLLSWLKKYPIAYNIVIIAVLLLVGVAVVYIAMALGTRHYSQRTVPNFI